MSIILATKTFEADAEQHESTVKLGWVDGTADVTFQGKTRRTKVLKRNESQWVVYGLCGRYPTGGKVWPATVYVNIETRNVGVHLGFDSRSGRHGQPRLTGFLDDVGAGHISKR